MKFDNKKRGIRLGVKDFFNIPIRLINGTCIAKVLPLALEFGQLKKKSLSIGQF
jgi:hypothetical protein